MNIKNEQLRTKDERLRAKDEQLKIKDMKIDLMKMQLEHKVPVTHRVIAASNQELEVIIMERREVVQLKADVEAAIGLPSESDRKESE